MPWRVFAASAKGSGHADTGIPCQDAFAHEVVGDVLVAVVCDGAGSSALSHEGAQSTAAGVVGALASRLRRGEALTAVPPETLVGVLAEVVGAARDLLESQAVATGRDLSDYAATLVGALVSSDRGYLFHVGDGVAVARPRRSDGSESVSRPENGEYANETFFVTGEDWRAHLRVLPLPDAVATVALMSDGAAHFVMSKDNRGLYRPFMDPVERYLAQASPAEGSEALASTLDDPRTRSITEDDKTLLIACWA